MSLAGFRKQINKANQYVSEKIGGAKGTELDIDYTECEKKIDTIGKLIDEVVVHTQEYLQPNPASRARMVTMNTLSKLQGKLKNSAYPQPEGQLGECMVKYGGELGELYGESLAQAGEAFKQLADIKYQLEDKVKANFIEPMHSIQTHELKEINHHRKKLEGRRLDFDCKKRRQEKGGKLPEEELRAAEEKFEESKKLAESAMVNFLTSDIEHVRSLTEFITATEEYHKQAAETLGELRKLLNLRLDEESSKPRPAIQLHKRSTINRSPEGSAGSEDGKTPDNSPPSGGNKPHSATKNGSTGGSPNSGACARALFDFDAENETELPFKEGDMVQLIQQVDENWYEGECHGKKGYFPVNYVDVVVPLT